MNSIDYFYQSMKYSVPQLLPYCLPLESIEVEPDMSQADAFCRAAVVSALTESDSG
jgi:hypothetical protein